MAIIRPIIKAEASQVDDEAVLQELRDLGFALRNGQYQVAKANLQQILRHIPALKSKNIHLLNTLTSLQEGLASREITKKDFTDQLRAEFTAYKLYVEKSLSELRVPSQKEEMLSLDELISSQKSTLTQFESSRDDLEKRVLSSGVVVAYAPVIPITQPLLDVTKLKSNGFKADTFMGYPIIHKMLVAGISTERILAQVAANRGDKKPNRKKSGETTQSGTAPSTPQEREEALAFFLDTIQTRYPQLKLIPVGGTHQWYDATWYFLMPQAHFNLLKRCTTSPTPVQSLIFKRWTFPFSSKV